MAPINTEGKESLTDPKLDHFVPSYVRAGGALYLFIIAAGLFSEVFVRSQLIVAGDASATAANILGSQHLYRAGLSAELLMLVCDVALAVIFFVVLRSVGFLLALFAACLRLVMAAISGTNLLNHMDALLWLNGASTSEALGSSQVQEIAYHSLRSHAFGYHVALVFFGIYCVTLGILIVRCGFLPKLIGRLMILAGACYLANSFGATLAIDSISGLGSIILLPALVAELSLALWMLIKGIDAEQWGSLQQVIGSGETRA